ncbi:tryptophan transporter [Alkaliphilus oremlandii]|uniref:Tryptophan transport protein n=1 Tax=Alkaliphilus oremlandii (strain OhILAs) TaxID=350688 RepID=A8MLN8_ALKOO|nr:tryptophan transporter [Alkaliphilus oremlandii]ABW17955.1 tryptophan transport protein [Alkaliphilus oremlandii OhILAs]
MKLKNNIFTALLLAIGFILHQITPGILGGMKFDFLLSFLFISLIVNTSFKNAVLTGLMGGLLSAITTTFPGGQIPNMIDKLLTSILLFLIIQFIRRFSMNTLAVGTISILGTLISGATFLLSALIIAGLPTSFSFLFKTVVLPTVLVNAALTIFIYHIIGQAMRVSGIQIE